MYGSRYGSPDCKEIVQDYPGVKDLFIAVLFPAGITVKSMSFDG
jgi:hypothetical protein